MFFINKYYHYHYHYHSSIFSIVHMRTWDYSAFLLNLEYILLNISFIFTIFLKKTTCLQICKFEPREASQVQENVDGFYIVEIIQRASRFSKFWDKFFKLNQDLFFLFFLNLIIIIVCYDYLINAIYFQVIIHLQQFVFILFK